MIKIKEFLERYDISVIIKWSAIILILKQRTWNELLFPYIGLAKAVIYDYQYYGLQKCAIELLDILNCEMYLFMLNICKILVLDSKFGLYYMFMLYPHCMAKWQALQCMLALVWFFNEILALFPVLFFVCMLYMDLFKKWAFF